MSYRVEKNRLLNNKYWARCKYEVLKYKSASKHINTLCFTKVFIG